MTNQAIVQTKGGIKDRLLSAYRTWFWLGVATAVVGLGVILLRTMNEMTLGPLLLAKNTSSPAYQTATTIEAITSRTWMQLLLLSLSFFKFALAGAIYVGIKHIRARRAEAGDNRTWSKPFYERFFPISEVLGSETQIFNFFVLTLIWDANAFSQFWDKVFGTVVPPVEFFGASFSLAGIVFALATYAAEPKTAFEPRRQLPQGLLGFSYLAVALGISGLLVWFPIRASALITISNGAKAVGAAAFASAVRIDAVAGLLVEPWVFLGVGGLFLAWALWLWQAAKNDNNGLRANGKIWTTRIVPALASVGYAIVVTDFLIAIAGTGPLLAMVQGQLSGAGPSPILLTVGAFQVVSTMLKMTGVGLIMIAIAAGSTSYLIYARGARRNVNQTLSSLGSFATWKYWAALIPGAAIVLFITLGGSMMLIQLMGQWAPVVMMGAPASRFPGFDGAFLVFRLLMAMGPGTMMLGLVLTFVAAARYLFSADRVWCVAK